MTDPAGFNDGLGMAGSWYATTARPFAPCPRLEGEIGKARGVSVARVALAWLLGKPHVMSVIIGAKTVEQLDDNLAAVGLVLSPAETAKLDEASKLPAEYPGWMFERQGSARRPKPFAATSA